jgi:hypothetical protein
MCNCSSGRNRKTNNNFAKSSFLLFLLELVVAGLSLSFSLSAVELIAAERKKLYRSAAAANRIRHKESMKDTIVTLILGHEFVQLRSKMEQYQHDL